MAAFEQTPRHVFVPAFYTPSERRAAGTLVCAQDTEDADEWLDTVYRNEALLTQHRAVNSDVEGVPTSSSTWPSAMAVMFERLRVQDGDSVLEIGTGTGYNAALLCHRLGDSHVTSIEIDPELTRQARGRLADLGHHPTLISGDGTAGAPDRAPFDAVIATCAVSHIPPRGSRNSHQVGDSSPRSGPPPAPWRC
jgi:protein-L-isoaspartate O-methyltransferase